MNLSQSSNRLSDMTSIVLTSLSIVLDDATIVLASATIVVNWHHLGWSVPPNNNAGSLSVQTAHGGQVVV